jgi:hypothetical protein
MLMDLALPEVDEVIRLADLAELLRLFLAIPKARLGRDIANTPTIPLDPAAPPCVPPAPRKGHEPITVDTLPQHEIQ